MIGKVELPLDQYHKLHDQAKLASQGEELAIKALNVGFKELYLSIIRLLRGNGVVKQVIVDEFDGDQVIKDIVFNDKVLHLLLIESESSDKLKFVIKTGPKDTNE